MSNLSDLQTAANSAVEGLAADVNTVLSSSGLGADPQARALRKRIETSLAIVREAARQKGQLAARKGRKAATHVNTYAHERPWHIVAVGLAVGLAAGLLLSRRDD